MSFESCMTVLREELNVKYPVVKRGEKVNDDERRLQLIDKIQLITWHVVEDIASGRPPVFDSVARATWENCCFDGRVKFKQSERKTKHIKFIRRNGRMEFAMIVFLLSKTHKLLMTQQTSTRRLCTSAVITGIKFSRTSALPDSRFFSSYFRELYYENVKLFKSQKRVDDGMREICCLLNAPAWELRVSATSKGIVAGPVVLTLRNGESIDCGRPGGVSIPQNILCVEKMSSSATWVLIVEKDACFQKLITTQAENKLGSCILITGKGFPDVDSRMLVCKFWEHLQVPILVLVDADPHGFEIMCVYRFGSLSMSPHSGHLACPAVRWIGIHPSDIRPLLLDSKELSVNDRKKIGSLLRRSYVEDDDRLKTQLEILLEGNAKAEIEGVTSIAADYLTHVYLKNKIRCKEYL